MRTFRYVSPASVEEAVSVLRQHGRRARVIAGGTDLLGEMKGSILPDGDYPEVIVNIKKIPGLDCIVESDQGLFVGALVRLEDLARHKIVAERYPALAEAARRTASPHIREMGTVGGNICQNNRCWYYWTKDNLFPCLRKGGRACYAVTGDARYHSIFGAARVGATACARACPNGIDIPGYLELLREGDLESAARLLLERNPLPAVTGRVCPHWCEEECARNEFDQALAVRELERFLGDYVLDHSELFYQLPAASSGRRVAVVGAGPAGLSAAFYLRRAGHEVTVFDRSHEPGGLLSSGIPPYRLPRSVVRRQVEGLERMGVRLVLGGEVDKAAFDRLRREYDAVFIGAGAGKETPVGIAGEECLWKGTDFLRQMYLEPEDLSGKTVGVIGGGNTAIDVARSLLRLGARPVVVYRRSKSEMPALEEEVRKAEEEGVCFEFLTQPVSATRQAGGVDLICCRMALGSLDESGRPRPVPLEGSEFLLRCDAVIKAIVEQPDYSFLPEGMVGADGRLELQDDGLALAEGVFAGGDFVTGPRTVAEAISAGREAARAIDRFLGGQRDEGGALEPAPGRIVGETFSVACLAPGERVQVPEAPLSERLHSLALEELSTLDEGSARSEAERCFNCGCVAVNCSDLAPALIVLGARVKTSERVVDAEDFFSSEARTSTVLREGEMVLGVEMPPAEPRARSCFLKFALRKSIDFPIVNCAAQLVTEGETVRQARICVNSVFAVPLRLREAEILLQDRVIDERVAEEAAQAAIERTFALPGNRYKIQIAKTLVKRAILACRPSD